MVGIVILNYNNSSQTLACLDTLYKHCQGNNWKVCVVDNASRKEELEKLQSSCKEHIVISTTNCGYARGNNLGLQWFEKDDEVDSLLVLNDDTRFTSDVITPLHSYLKNHKECGVVFPLVVAPDGKVDVACWRRQKSIRNLFEQATSVGKIKRKFGCSGGRDEFLPLGEIPDAEAVETGVPPGSCMMLRKDVFKSVGYLDPHTFLYFEEHILVEKLRREGLACVLMPKISIIHLGAQTTKKSASKVIYGHWRDSYLYFMKNYSRMPVLLQYYLRFRTWIALSIFK